MQRALQFVEHVSAKVSGDGLALDDRADDRRLGLQHRLDEIVDRVLGDDIGDVHGSGLADSIGAILCLPVIRRHPVEVVEHHLARRRQIHPGAAGDDVGQEHADRLILLKPIDDALPCVARRLPREHHRHGAELSCELPDRTLEA